jgi:hypothetical protein
MRVDVPTASQIHQYSPLGLTAQGRVSIQATLTVGSAALSQRIQGRQYTALTLGKRNMSPMGVSDFRHVQTDLQTPYESFLVGTFCDDSGHSWVGIHLQNTLRAISGTLPQGFLRFLGCTGKRTYIASHLRKGNGTPRGASGFLRACKRSARLDSGVLGGDAERAGKGSPAQEIHGTIAAHHLQGPP